MRLHAFFIFHSEKWARASARFEAFGREPYCSPEASRTVGAELQPACGLFSARLPLQGIVRDLQNIGLADIDDMRAAVIVLLAHSMAVAGMDMPMQKIFRHVFFDQLPKAGKAPEIGRAHV